MVVVGLETIEMMNWKEVAITRLIEQIEAAQQDIHSLRQSLEGEAKSTAGDKHETGRAMIQMDMERASERLHEGLERLAAAKKWFMECEAQSWEAIRVGHAVETDDGSFLLGPPLGKITAHGLTCFALSTASPLGQQLMGKRVGDLVSTGSKTFTVLSFS